VSRRHFALARHAAIYSLWHWPTWVCILLIVYVSRSQWGGGEFKPITASIKQGNCDIVNVLLVLIESEKTLCASRFARNWASSSRSSPS
jgi:hypothetical protein